MTSPHKDALGNEDTAGRNASGQDGSHHNPNQERPRIHRSRKLRIGAVAVAGALAFFGIAGASVQNDQLRANLVSLTSPTAAPESKIGRAHV